MITSPILEEKYRVQRKLAEESGYDVRKHFELCRKIVAETEAEYGLKFTYGRRDGGGSRLACEGSAKGKS
uniref:Uncharacterized protein n=1 Tax=Candidatus Kentrum sp. MB TaxID=2138164 RepID=A0A450XU64_9GAMM|nr:MAG: hypothetical protein BECKMB1821G_GA0114241_103713 [Candidatus Kentron sp. MB]VFK32851.1 MAG: hypothetical protein BECKMB1821I_GA0114274_103712 [Candidatus Kentron sp. MB]VFK75936.1 MAG: hypothetical protein BECKMB1821H_GA0114242_103615 [Candidatus Kentron sp. MB]